MNKIPVWKTIAYAYSFTFAHLGTIVGLIWIPMVISSVGTFFVMRPYYEASLAAAANGTAMAGGPMMVYLFAFEAIALLILAMIGVAITREALGLRKPGPVFAHFSLGASEFRVFGAFLILMGLYLGFVLAYFLAVVVVGGIAGVLMKTLGSGASAGGAVVAAAIAVAGFGALIYAMVRLTFLVVPATVAEGKVGIIRSWQLTSGSFWRIMLIGLFTLLPIVIVVAVLQVVIVGADVFIPTMETLRNPAKEAEFIAHQSRAMLDHMPMIMGLSFLAAPILNGLIFAPSAIAYRALVPPGTEPRHEAV